MWRFIFLSLPGLIWETSKQLLQLKKLNVTINYYIYVNSNLTVILYLCKTKIKLLHYIYVNSNSEFLTTLYYIYVN